jgi:hypothetical protein
LDKLAELLRDGVTPVLSKHGFRREARNYSLLSEDGDLVVISFDNGDSPPGAATEINAGCFPRYFLERLNKKRGKPDRVPHATMAMFKWRVCAPPDSSFAPDRGTPFVHWWALGERTEETGRVLSAELEESVVPKLLSLMNADAQYAAIETEWPNEKLFYGSRWSARVITRLGRATRSEVEALLDGTPTDEESSAYVENFRAWAWSRYVFPHSLCF